MIVSLKPTVLRENFQDCSTMIQSATHDSCSSSFQSAKSARKHFDLSSCLWKKTEDSTNRRRFFNRGIFGFPWQFKWKEEKLIHFCHKTMHYGQTCSVLLRWSNFHFSNRSSASNWSTICRRIERRSIYREREQIDEFEPVPRESTNLFDVSIGSNLSKTTMKLFSELSKRSTKEVFLHLCFRRVFPADFLEQFHWN